MGFFDALFGTNTTAATDRATGQANALIGGTENANGSIINAGANQANAALTGGTQNALASLLGGYNGATGAVQNYSQQAQNALTNGVNSAVNTVQGSNAMFAPYLGSGQAANTMYGNALGLNGTAGNTAATGAFQTSPGYQFQVDQATDAAARKAASLGMAASGNTLSAITTLGNNLANQEYGSWLDRLNNVSSQGLSAAGAISGNNALAAGYQYGGAGALANLLNNEGTTLAGLNTGLGTGQAGLQSGLGNSLANVATGAANAQVQNGQWATGNIGHNLLSQGSADDAATNANNGIFSKLLLGAAGSALNSLKL